MLIGKGAVNGRASRRGRKRSEQKHPKADCSDGAPDKDRQQNYPPSPGDNSAKFERGEDYFQNYQQCDYHKCFEVNRKRCLRRGDAPKAASLPQQ